MKNIGIVCEFNPLHNGHERLLRYARELGAERVVCVMSGNATQRGELSVLDKYTRAKAAIALGADLVLELPFPWSSASAEYFARAAVLVLSGFCDTLLFGSECGDIELICRAATLASGDDFREEYRRRTRSGEGAAGVYFEMLREAGAPLGSNDLLGVEYVRAIGELGADMTPCTLKREGAGYNDESIDGASYPSATAIRKLWQELGFEDSAKHMPRAAYEIYEKAYFEGEMCDIYQLSRAILMYFRLRSPEDLQKYAECEGGIANRISALAHECSSLEELYERLSTKRYTDAKLRRAILFSLTEVTRELLQSTPEYTTLLAANAKGRELLSAQRKSGGIRVVTKPADEPTDSKQSEASHRLDAIFTLAKMQPNASGEYMRRGAYIE
jgi:predicted nucleotidyltransferase